MLKNNISVAIRRGDRIAAVNYSRQLIAEAGAGFEDRLQHLGLLERMRSGGFDAYLTQLQSEAAADPQKVHALATLLVERNLNNLAQRWLAILPEEMQSSQRVMMARADAALARHDWPELVKLLSDGPWGDSDYVRRAMLARAYRELDEPASSENEWRSAVSAANDHSDALATLAKMAGLWGWSREQDEILWSIVRDFPGETWPLESLAHNYTQRADTFGLHLVYTTWIQLRPDDLMARNNLAATSLLLQSRMERAHELASEVYASDEMNPAFASTYAFSLHLQGRTPEALLAMARLPPHQLETPSVAVYYAAMLAEAGAQEMARMYVRRAEQGVLLPEERTLLLATDDALREAPPRPAQLATG